MTFIFLKIKKVSFYVMALHLVYFMCITFQPWDNLSN